MKLGQVKQTTAAELKNSFTSHEFQRQIVPAKVRNYMASMRKYGFWNSHPIVWFKYNGKKMVIWGHHRREAALQLGIPSFTQELTGATISETVDMITAENWSTWKLMDSIQLNVRRGDQNYIILWDYIQRGLGLSLATSLLSGYSGNSNSKNPEVKTGKFKVKTTEAADTLLGFIERMFTKHPLVKRTSFLQAISRCLNVAEFSLAQFEKRLNSNPAMLEKRANVSDYNKLIEAIYNHASRSPIPLAFLADKITKQRAVAQPKDA